LGSSILVLAAAVAFGVSGRLLEAVGGLHPLRAPAALDLEKPGSREEGDLAPFFVARDQLEFTVDQGVGLAEFRERYRLGNDAIREAGNGGHDLGSNDRLLVGKKYEVLLTPRRVRP
jgi:hypothetical protein